jgi:hypothetical protein
VRAQYAALVLWGVEVHRRGGIKAARMLDILERNVATWRKGLPQEWTLLDIADGSERACAIVRELKEMRRREGREELEKKDAEEAGGPATGAVAGTEPGEG